jgi:general secretion pathway protein J
MKARGFTLIELLVAIGILAVVAVLGWRGLDGIIRARVSLTEQLEQTRDMQLTFAQMQSDCASVAPLTVIGNSRPQLVADGERLRLVRTVFVDDQPSRLEVVVYRLKDGILTRRESQPTRDLKQLDSLWSSTADDTADNSASDLPPVVLQTGVTSMAMRMWLGNGPWQTNATASTTTVAAAPGQTSNPNALRGLEVSLRTKSSDAVMIKSFLVGPV